MGDDPRFQFLILGRYPSLVSADDPHVTIEVRVGRRDRLVNSGTLSLRESEWEALRAGLERGCAAEVEVVDWPKRIPLPA